MRGGNVSCKYRVLIKYCVLSWKCNDFLNSASSAAAMLSYLPGVYTHTDTKGKQRKARVRNILKIFGKKQYLMNTLYVTTEWKSLFRIIGSVTFPWSHLSVGRSVSFGWLVCLCLFYCVCGRVCYRKFFFHIQWPIKPNLKLNLALNIRFRFHELDLLTAFPFNMIHVGA